MMGTDVQVLLNWNNSGIVLVVQLSMRTIVLSS